MNTYAQSKSFAVLKWSSILFLITTIILVMWRPLIDLFMFSDFAETLSYCLVDNPYTGSEGVVTVYPPFAFLPFYLFALIAKVPLEGYIQGTMTLKETITHPAYIASFLLFHLICLAVIMFVSAKISKFKGEKLFFLLVLIFAFGPLLFCFFRGNNIIFAVMFCMLFFWLQNSEKRWQRELANFFLACAIAVKLYPALILLFFIKDRRFLDMLKTIIYAVLLLVIPFIFIEDGFSNIGTLLDTFTSFNSEADRSLSRTNISLDSLAHKFGAILSPVLGESTGAFQSIASKILRFGLIIFTIISLALSKNTKHKIQPILLCILTYALFQGISYAYVFSFLIIPVIEYFVDFDNLSTFNKWFFGIAFILICNPGFAIFDNFLVAQMVSPVVAVKCIVDIISEFARNRKLKQLS